MATWRTSAAGLKTASVVKARDAAGPSIWPSNWTATVLTARRAGRRRRPRPPARHAGRSPPARARFASARFASSLPASMSRYFSSRGFQARSAFFWASASAFSSASWASVTQRPPCFLYPSRFRAAAWFGSSRVTIVRWAFASASSPFSSHQRASFHWSSAFTGVRSRRALYSLEGRGQRGVGLELARRRPRAASSRRRGRPAPSGRAPWRGRARSGRRWPGA